MSPEVALLVIKLLDVVAAGVRLAPDILRRKDEYVRQIEAMIREDRGPTNAELNALLRESDQLTQAIKAEKVLRAHRNDTAD
ncbi:MAG: hypothetical protein V3T08_10085 [Gemmatimonadota bacterium]